MPDNTENTTPSTSLPVVGEGTTKTETTEQGEVSINIPPEQVQQMIDEAMQQEHAAQQLAVRRDKLQMIAAFVAGGICAREGMSPHFEGNHAGIAEASVGIASAILARVDEVLK